MLVRLFVYCVLHLLMYPTVIGMRYGRFFTRVFCFSDNMFATVLEHSHGS